ncbi:uncharacterized protein LOC110027034 [Phalaenopsis equestris]|uniref:uncharacterized protein LOC110027034 n=1 Tax=Phalaenopsis equestris TaxID=78828 RepID=UPI0009E3318B|nr:uncharacterized protein LOC110027034 [Phalaenopsis equestris]
MLCCLFISSAHRPKTRRKGDLTSLDHEYRRSREGPEASMKIAAAIQIVELRTGLRLMLTGRSFRMRTGGLICAMAITCNIRTAVLWNSRLFYLFATSSSCRCSRPEASSWRAVTSMSSIT